MNLEKAVVDLEAFTERMDSWRDRARIARHTPQTTLLESTNKLAEGEAFGYVYAILHNSNGFRCGYIRIPDCHPWFGRADWRENQISADVHGGITFGQLCHDGWWIGFDCAHYNDAQDPSLPYETDMGRYLTGTIRTTEYVKAECVSLCRQADEVWNETHGVPYDDLPQ